MKKFIALLLIVHVSTPRSEADERVLEFSLEETQFTFLTPPVRFEDLSGAMIAELSKKKGLLPVLYPRRESFFHWLDTGDRDLLSFDQLIADPDLFKKPVHLIKKNLFIPGKVQENDEKVPKKNLVKGGSDQSVSRPDLLNSQSETPAPVISPITPSRASDPEFQALRDDGKDAFLFQREAQSLSRLVERHKSQNGGIALPVPPEFRPKQVNSQRFQQEAQIFSDPKLLEEYERRISTSTLGRMSADKRKKSWNGSLPSDPGVPGNLKLKASMRTSDGKILPAQASDFYLTTRDLHELLKDMDAEQALAGEVKSVAEIWANAEKNLSTNPEIALGVKSILLQAKVGRTRTNAAGLASLHDLPPDEKYFLIGIDKDENTNVVTIWSKEIEVNPGDNVVELSSSDVIYQD
jgi:hypothetical protein